MERARPTDSSSEESLIPLYDFLYRDSNRLASYSAQIWGGVTQSVETTGSTRRADDKRTQIAAATIVTHEEKLSKETGETKKETLLPHDVVSSDILSHLLQSGRVVREVETAPHGSLVLAQGTMVFLDRDLIRTAALITSDVVDRDDGNFDVGEGDEAGQITVNFSLQQLFKNFDFPSAFLLQGTGDVQVCGTLKESGMEEPISTYYFKHGNAGLSDVFLVGIKETPNPSLTLAESNLMSVTQGLAQSLSELVMPVEAVRVTPIAIFRKL